MNTTKLSSEFVMEPDLIKALKLLHSKKKPKKTSLLSLYNGVLKTMTPNLSPEVLKSIKPRASGGLHRSPGLHSGKSCKSLTSHSGKTSKPSYSKANYVSSSKHSNDHKKISSKSQSSSQKKIKSSLSSKEQSSSVKSKPASKERLLAASSCFSKAMTLPKPSIKQYSKQRGSTPTKSTFLLDDSTTEDESDSMVATKGSNFSVDADDNACRVCKKMNFNSKNQLVECQECHSMYHQECHTPRMLSSDILDPRFVWYCAKCSIQMNQMTQKSVRANDYKNLINQGNSNSLLNKPFRRFDTSMTSLKDKPPSSSSTSQRPVHKHAKGLSGMAANISRQCVDKPKHSISFLQNLPTPQPAKQKSSKSSKKKH